MKICQSSGVQENVRNMTFEFSSSLEENGNPMEVHTSAISIETSGRGDTSSVTKQCRHATFKIGI